MNLNAAAHLVHLQRVNSYELFKLSITDRKRGTPAFSRNAGGAKRRQRRRLERMVGSTPRIACIYLRYLPLPPISRHPRLNDASPAEKIQKQIPNTLGRKRLSSTMTCRRTSRSAAKSYSFVSNHLYMTKAST